MGALRDHGLALACLREGALAVQARGYDDLSAETLARFEDTHVGALAPEGLRAALAASVVALLHEGAEAGLPHADAVALRLAEFHWLGGFPLGKPRKIVASRQIAGFQV